MRKEFSSILAAAVAASVTLAVLHGAQKKWRTSPVGYTDTPVLPGQKWKVHDIDRPQPPVVLPGARPGQPPSDAVVLFDGKDFSQWTTRDGKPPAWRLAEGAMVSAASHAQGEKSGTGDLLSKVRFGSAQIHVEFATPNMPQAKGQARGNSGVYLQARYEIQVLDSYQNPTYANGSSGALYGRYAPLVNASRPPEEWQTYDIIFEAPVFDGDKLVRPVYFTVFHNGVMLHNHKESLGPMVFRQVAHYTPHEPTASLMLQNHNNPVHYRNIWVRPVGEYDKP